ncbi:MAG: hypothetical protein QF632_05595 [Candidatus Woesearchaeota archaeon]|jgi:hypothetical protein|nr:hypothetical protein [Candidatus Woesearchaeota archaeon]
MFFHHDGLYYFIEQVKIVQGLSYFKTSFEARGKGGYHHYREAGKEKLEYFRIHILPKLKKHVDDIQHHINEGDLLKKVHELILEKRLHPALAGTETTHPRALSQDENDFQEHLGMVRSDFEQIHEIVVKLDQLMEGSNPIFINLGHIDDNLNLLLKLLKSTYTTSIELGNLMKSFLIDIREDHDLKQQMLDDETVNIQDFQRNIQSWFHRVQ